MDLGRLNFSINKNDKYINKNYQLIKIIDIRKNEHFGDIFMFLQKPSPFTLTVKSRLAELFLLRKHDAMIISESFSNIWRRIYKNSYHNLVSIKELIHNRLNRYYNTYFYNKENKIVNISKLDVTIPKLSRKNTDKSNISKIIRKSKTLTRLNSTINNNNNTLINSQIDLPNKRKISEDNSFNNVNFSDSFTNSTNNKNRSRNKSNDNYNTINEKFTFKKESQSPVNRNKNNHKNIFCENKESSFTNTFNKINKNQSLVKNSNKTAEFKNMEKSLHDEENTITENLSNYSGDENGFLILEDINANFAKKIKNKINKKSKYEKIRYLFELQKQQYIKILNELYSQINNQNSKKNNYYNIFYNIHKKLDETHYIISNSEILSILIDSEEEKINLSTKKRIQFDSESLKKISSESFEIKSSYENIKVITKGDIIKNKKYKDFLEILIHKNVNNNFNEENIEKILKKFEYNQNKEISEENNEKEKYSCEDINSKV